MKISKLFHWLYALVMFLPFFAILSTILVNTFNQKANETTETTIVEVPTYYETNELNSNTDFLPNRIYTYLGTNNYDYDDNNNLNLMMFDLIDLEETKVQCNIPTELILYRMFLRTTDEIYFIARNSNNTETYYNVNSKQFTFGINQVLSQFYNVSSMNNDFYTYFSESNLLIQNGTTQEEQITYIQNDIFYYAVDKVENSPLFSWAYNSFLAQPIVYIITLFSIPSNHFVVELLSYWLAISIVWLVFDLIMYVPLLVHRWIDKGVLE